MSTNQRAIGKRSWTLLAPSVHLIRHPGCWAYEACRAIGLRSRLLRSLAIERELQQLLFQSEDAKEGIAAYTEKRTPQFKAR